MMRGRYAKMSLSDTWGTFLADFLLAGSLYWILHCLLAPVQWWSFCYLRKKVYRTFYIPTNTNTFKARLNEFWLKWSPLQISLTVFNEIYLACICGNCHWLSCSDRVGFRLLQLGRCGNLSWPSSGGHNEEGDQTMANMVWTNHLYNDIRPNWNVQTKC